MRASTNRGTETDLRIEHMRADQLEESVEFLAKTYEAAPGFLELSDRNSPAEVRERFRQAVTACLTHTDCAFVATDSTGRMLGCICAIPQIRERFSEWIQRWNRDPWRTSRGLWIKGWHWIATRLRPSRSYGDYGRLQQSQAPRVGCVCVLNLAVDPEFRGCGIARRLIEIAERHWRFHTMLVATRVETWAEENRRIYERMGFTLFADGRRGQTSCYTLLREFEDQP